jgi:hypothetical protein
MLNENVRFITLEQELTALDTLLAQPPRRETSALAGLVTTAKQGNGAMTERVLPSNVRLTQPTKV